MAAAASLGGVVLRELRRLPPGTEGSALVVALSGGLDSVVLLATLAALRAADRLGRPLRAVHVNHQLQAGARAWEAAARELCARLGVPLVVRRLRLVVARGASLEAVARAARYGALGAALAPGEVLLTAHHEDDQLETLLLQLMRGAGVAGLAAMPACARFGNGFLLRPLLAVPRAQILGAARAQGLRWQEDPSNAAVRFDRNYLRLRVLPALRARWPSAARVAARSASHLGEARELLDELAAADLARLARPGAGGPGLDRSELALLSGARQRNVVRAWIASQGLPVPDSRHLARILGELQRARADSKPLVAWRGAEVRRHGALLYCMAPLPPHDAARVLEWNWRGTPRLALGQGLGELRLVRSAHGALDGARLPAQLQVRFRAGGERLRGAAGGSRRALKDWLREANVLPWMRARIPLVFAGERCVAAAGVLTSADFAAAPGAGRAPRFELRWQGGPCCVRVAAAAADSGAV